MPLYIKDPAVDNLLEQYLSATSETNKTEAIRMLLTDGLRRLAEKETLAQRVGRIQDRAAAIFAASLPGAGADR